MDNMRFCYWLHGYFEIGEVSGQSSPYLNLDQLDIVRDHIKLVSENSPWICGFIQWLQGIIDGTRILNTNNADLVNISRVIKVKLADVFDKKTPDYNPQIIGDGLPNPPRFPPLYVPDPLRQPGVTCSPNEPVDLTTQVSWEDQLQSVLSQHGPGGGSGKVFCAKED